MSVTGAALEGLPVARAPRAPRSRAAGVRRSHLSNALFVLPFVLLYAALVLVPLVQGLWISLHEHDLLSDEHTFIGLENFANLADDEYFLQVMWNTLRFVLISVPVFVVLSLALALALNRPGRLGAFLRGAFFSASVLSVTVVTLVWRLALIPQHGLVAQLLSVVGLGDVNFLTSEALALPTIALITVWWIVGLPMMLFLSALQQLPGDVYEAAALDNATRWRTFVSVTLPALKRTVFLVTIIEVIRECQVFPQILLLTNGGPNNSTRSIVQFVYEQAFVQLSLGYSAAASQVLFAFLLVAVSVQLWLERDRTGGRR
jgi:multiple sugar transport system permease protein